jgi:hypothetical protein
VYGSLVDPRKLDEVLGYHFLGERLRARLSGFERVLADGFDYPFLVAQPAHVVEGILIMDLSARDLDVLDRYEEVEVGLYQRIAVEVEMWGCGPKPAFLAAHTYVAGPRLLATAS